MAKPSVHITRNGVEKKFWGGKRGRKCPPKKKIRTRICGGCGVTYTPKRAWQAFCAVDCRERRRGRERAAARPKRVPIGTASAPFGAIKCLTCNANFKSTRSGKRYCSHKCYRLRVSRDWRNENRSRGTCYHCDEPPVAGTVSWCEKHWLVQLAWRSGLRGRGSSRKILDLLIAQNYTCPYTGRKLVIGVNASIDHVDPRSLFPDRVGEIGNLEWVDADINRAKRTLSREEFVAMCKQVAQYTDQRGSQRHQTALGFRRAQE